MMDSLESDRRLFQSLFRCMATGRRAFSTMQASVGMDNAAVGSTEATSAQSASVSSDRSAQDLRPQTGARRFGPPTLADEVPIDFSCCP
jgi:hypothetical protein